MPILPKLFLKKKSLILIDNKKSKAITATYIKKR